MKVLSFVVQFSNHANQPHKTIFYKVSNLRNKEKINSPRLQLSFKSILLNKILLHLPFNKK